MGRNVLVGNTALIVAACRRSSHASIVALVTHDAGVGALRANRVQERQEHALLHELVDLGHSLIQG